MGKWLNTVWLLKFTKGADYKGDWKDDKMSRKVIYNDPNGDIYEGEWKDLRWIIMESINF